MNTVSIRIPRIVRVYEIFNLNFFSTIILVSILFNFQVPAGIAAALNDIEAVPHLDNTGRQGYREFLAAEKHRAFVISPGGAWFWKSGESDAASAAENALLACLEETGLACLPYAVNDKVVFDEKAWAQLWGPYQSRTEAARAYIGNERGNRFYDLAFKNSSGKLMKLSDYKGKVVVLHFWGSWCPSCLREMPELQQLYHAMSSSSDIQLVLLQVREKFASGQQWARQHQLDLPLHDSRVTDSSALDALSLAGGKAIHDRDIATAFPTTYILDKRGIVVFAHVGSISGWMQYLPLLRDVADKSGK